MKLYTNSNDAVLKTRLEQLCNNTTVYISTAFFSNFEFINKCLENNCEIYLIVRLDFGTNPYELQKVIELKNPNIYIRYYACKEFHPKFYIIENVCVFIGSSNLTHKGLLNNLEINVEIDSENLIYEELKKEFWLEWEYAKPLTKEKIIDFKNKYEQYSLLDSNRIFFNENERVSVPKIKDLNRKDKKNEEITKFQKDYQLYINAFTKLVKMYIEISPERKYNKELPIRIEIDRFLSWIKDLKYEGEDYLKIKKKSEDEIKTSIKGLKDEFINYEFTTIKKKEYYDNTFQRYIEIVNKLGVKENILKQNKEELFEALNLINAIHDQLRFNDGGLETLKKEFLKNNDENKIKNTLIYLLEGKENYIERIYNIVHLSIYKLDFLGENSIKELYGYINNDDIPTCNQRMLHSMQWLGFGKL